MGKLGTHLVTISISFSNCRNDCQLESKTAGWNVCSLVTCLWIPNREHYQRRKQRLYVKMWHVFVSFQEQDDPNATHWPDHYIERINTMSCVSKSLLKYQEYCSSSAESIANFIVWRKYKSLLKYQEYCSSSPESIANFIVWRQHHLTQFHNGLLCLSDESH